MRTTWLWKHPILKSPLLFHLKHQQKTVTRQNRAHERKAVVVSAPPTKIEYKSLTEVQSSAKAEKDKEKSSVSAKAKESAQSFKGIVKSVG